MSYQDNLRQAQVFDELIKKGKSNFQESKQQPLEVKFIPCEHDKCPECKGTARKKDGSICIHYISCNCPKCQPNY